MDSGNTVDNNLCDTINEGLGTTDPDDPAYPFWLPLEVWSHIVNYTAGSDKRMQHMDEQQIHARNLRAHLTVLRYVDRSWKHMADAIAQISLGGAASAPIDQTRRFCTWAGANAHTNILFWATKEMGCPLYWEDVMYSVALSGSIADVSAFVELFGLQCVPSMHKAAATRGYLEMMKWLYVSHGCAPPGTALVDASAHGHADVVQWVLDTVTVGDAMQYSALREGMKFRENTQHIKHLCERVLSSQNEVTREITIRELFQDCGSYGNIRMATELLDMFPNHGSGISDAHAGAVNAGRVDVLVAIDELSKGQYIYDIFDLVLCAARAGSVPTLLWLIERNNTQGRKQRIPSQRKLCEAAAQSGSVDMLRFILGVPSGGERDGDADDDNNNADAHGIWQACGTRDTKPIRMLELAKLAAGNQHVVAARWLFDRARDKGSSIYVPLSTAVSDNGFSKTLSEEAIDCLNSILSLVDSPCHADIFSWIDALGHGSTVVWHALQGAATESAMHIGDARQLEWLINEKNCCVNLETGAHIAGAKGHLEILRVLETIGSREDIMARFRSPTTPCKFTCHPRPPSVFWTKHACHAAAEHGCIAVLEFMTDPKTSGWRHPVDESTLVNLAKEHGHLNVDAWLLARARRRASNCSKN